VEIKTKIIFLEEIKMNKTDLVNAVAAAGFTKKDADKAVAAVFEAIEGALAKGDKVQLIGFGTFEVRERAAKEGRNPKTGETIKIAASKVPAFKAGAALKNAVK
jgi:DNA-binding protein HU-beta